MKFLLILTLLVSNVVPAPLKYTEAKGELKITKATKIHYQSTDADMARNAQFLQEYIAQLTGIQTQLKAHKGAPCTFFAKGIILKSDLANDNKEAYTLTVKAKKAVITGSTPAGAFYGIQTLRKMIPVGDAQSASVAAVAIEDEPRVPNRGAMLDCARHFFPVEFVKEFIDILAFHNMNSFHWHLTDDQGWRIEVKKYPNLAEYGSIRKQTLVGHYGSNEYDGTPYGGYYTQEQIKDIVKYAADRNINIVPEIDMPGHMVAALASYNNLGCRDNDKYEVRQIWGIADEVLCMGKESTFEFIFGVLDEVVPLFPCPVFHIGGDECPTVEWEKCKYCQDRIKELGFKDDDHTSAERKLQGYFTKRVAEYLASKGKRIIGWDELLENEIPGDAMIMSWRGTNGGVTAAKMGHDVVMSPTSYCYIDYYQSKDIENEPLAIGGYLPVEKTYSFDPALDELTAEEAKHIVGVQANLWTEYIATPEYAEYMMLPRVSALSEVGWSAAGNKDYASFVERMGSISKIYDRMGWNYAKHIFQ